MCITDPSLTHNTSDLIAYKMHGGHLLPDGLCDAHAAAAAATAAL
jgi:hypothetical protein